MPSAHHASILHALPKMGDTYPFSCKLSAAAAQPPFIVTSCKHVFCDKHRDDPKLQARTCPGCSAHLDKIRHASYTVPKSELDVLNGVAPDFVLKIAGTALDFWCSRPPRMPAARHAVHPTPLGLARR